MIDAHAHLQAVAFADDLPALLDRASGVGIGHILVPGWDVDSSRAAIHLCQVHGSRGPRLAVAVGVHPHAAGAAGPAAWGEIELLASDGMVVAVGETGLDYDRLFSAREAQLANLRWHIDLARRIGKPLVLHCRSKSGRHDAQDELLDELERAGIGGAGWGSIGGGRPAAVLHSYAGRPEYAARALDLGLAVSFSGLVFRAGEGSSGAVARSVPTQRLLVETDAPYLTAPEAPRRRNEPAFVVLTLEWLAAMRGSEVPLLGRDLAANYERIFGLAQVATGSAGTS